MIHQDILDRIHQWKGEILLAAVFGTGILFDILGLWRREVVPESFIAVVLLQVGTALIIAITIAVTIELWMTKRIARDVFKAAFGYSMPDHFKDEIQRIADQRLICTKHRMNVDISLIDTEAVRVTIKIHREIKNIGPGSEPFPAMIHIDEWGFAEKSQIIGGNYRCDTQEIVILGDHAWREVDSTVKADAFGQMTVPKGKMAIATTEFIEIKRWNDHVIFGFKAPTENPIIHLTLPDELEGRAEAGIPDDQSGGESPAIPGQYEFTGVYFPPAHMRVRWWPKQATSTAQCREIVQPLTL